MRKKCIILGAIHYCKLIGVIVSMTYVFGVIAIFDKRLIGKRPYIRQPIVSVPFLVGIIAISPLD